MEIEVGISQLRDTLGIAVQHVAHTEDPIIIRRYKRTDVALVPLWEWRFLKQMEAAIRAGQIDVEAILGNLPESGQTCLDVGARSR